MSSSREERKESNFSVWGGIFWSICGGLFGGATGAASGLLGSGATNLFGSGEGHSPLEMSKTGAVGTAAVMGTTAFVFGGLYISGAFMRMQSRRHARASEERKVETEHRQKVEKDNLNSDSSSPTLFKEKTFDYDKSDDYALIKLGIGLAALYTLSQVAGGVVGHHLRDAEINGSFTMGQAATDMAIGGLATIPIGFLLAAGSVIGGFAFIVTHFSHGK